MNALEIFINKYTVTVKNSRGIDKREVKYGVMIEAIPTWNEGESVELYEEAAPVVEKAANDAADKAVELYEKSKK